MKYQEMIDANVQAKNCPFCNLKARQIIEESDYSIALLSRAPYVKDHMLFVPKRHLIYLRELSVEERTDLWLLVQRWLERLHFEYPGVNLLLRDWAVNSAIGKSVDHLHFHLIPNMVIGGQYQEMRDRPYYTQEDYGELLRQFRATFC